MNDHEAIRRLLPLVATGSTSHLEAQTVESHLGSCASCAVEFEEWKTLAESLRALPTPQPPSHLVRKTRSLAVAELSERAERRSNRRVFAFLVLFAWTMTIWPWMFLAAGDLQSWGGEYSLQLQIAAVAYVLTCGITAAVAAAIIGRRRCALGRRTA